MPSFYPFHKISKSGMCVCEPVRTCAHTHKLMHPRTAPRAHTHTVACSHPPQSAVHLKQACTHAHQHAHLELLWQQANAHVTQASGRHLVSPLLAVDQERHACPTHCIQAVWACRGGGGRAGSGDSGGAGNPQEARPLSGAFHGRVRAPHKACGVQRSKGEEEAGTLQEARRVWHKARSAFGTLHTAKGAGTPQKAYSSQGVPYLALHSLLVRNNTSQIQNCATPQHALHAQGLLLLTWTEGTPTRPNRL